MLRLRNVVVLYEHDVEFFLDALVLLYLARQTVDELDYALCVHVAARRFRAEDKGLRRDVLIGIVEQFEVIVHNFEHVEQLTLVLVQTFYLRVETRFGIELEARRL